MKEEIVCPLGSKCETIVSDHIEKCAWYVTLAGQHPQTGEMMNEQKCAMAWMPVMMVEMSNTNRGQTAAIESMRNEQVKGHNQFVAMVTGSQKALE